MAKWIMLVASMVALSVPLLCFASDINILQTSKDCEKYTYTMCPCGSDGGVVMIPVKLCYLKDKYLGKKKCQPCPGHELNDIFCDKYQNCKTCVSGSESCMTCPPGKIGKFCTEDAPQVMSLVPVFASFGSYPILIRIPRGGFPPHLRGRYARDTEGCPVPDNLETAEVECTIWPKHISCTESCIFGHTLADGMSRELTCKFEEDRWTPGEFDECKPYLDCTVQLVSAGDVFCTTGKMKSGASCDINCEEYEGNHAVPKTKYECQANGDWSPPLPFCVEKGKEQTVAPPPKGGPPAAAAAGPGVPA